MKSYIIRLKNNQHSERMSAECVGQAKKFNLDVEYFDGINGNDADDFFQSEEINRWYKFKNKMNRPGVKGCAASHYCLWKTCVDLNETLLILEHDAFMIRSLPENIEHCFEEICKLDKENPFLSTYDEKVNQHLENDIQIVDYRTDWGYKRHFAPYGGYFLGAWVYLIKPAAALKLVECFRQTGWIPADKQLAEKILKLQTTDQTIFRIHPEYDYKNIHEKSLTRNLNKNELQCIDQF